MPVNATFGTPTYHENGEIRVPVIFAENVIASKFVFEITHVSGDSLAGIEYRLVGANTAFEVVVQVPPDRSGSFSLDLAGSVFKVTDSTWDQVSATAVTVSYDTRIPFIKEYDVPATYTPEAIFDVKIAFSTIITGLHLNNVQDVFILEGAANVMGTPTPYKWTGATPPNLQDAAPSDLSGTDWERLAAPPAGNPTPGMNDFDDDGQWHGETGQFFMVRWTVDANTTGIFNMTLREGTLRGPIGS